MTVYFYGSKEPYWEFSNFSRYGITLDNEWWRTSEHYFQAQKFIRTDAAWAEKIRGIEKPRDAASMGRDRNHPIAPDWETTKDDVMRRAVLQKFQTHENLKILLLGTGIESIVEKTSGDYYWGCGTDGTGKNRLGEILMEVREALRGS